MSQMKKLSASNRKVLTPGEKTLNWLYEEQLRVDPEWSVRFSGGFTWWADQHAQTVEIVASEKDENGAIADLICVSTDLVRGLELTDQRHDSLALLMSCASMAGPVYDPKNGSLRLCSTARVNEENYPLLRSLISVASVLQIAEVRKFADDTFGWRYVLADLRSWAG